MNDISTKNKLLEAAKLLFSQKGYAAVSTRELAQEANVNLGAIKYHYESKENLFIEALLSLLEEESQNTWSFDPESTHPEAALSDFIHHLLVDLLDQSASRGCRLVHREALSETAEDENLKNIIVEAVVSNFITPRFSQLKKLIMNISPSLSETEVSRHSLSVIGQCHFYFSDRVFIEALTGWRLESAKRVKEISDHITQTTLKAL